MEEPLEPGQVKSSPSVIRLSLGTHAEVVEAVNSVTPNSMEAMLLARETRRWEFEFCRLGDSILRYALDGGPYMSHGSFTTGQSVFYISAPSAALRFCNGAELDDHSLFHWGAGSEFEIHVRRPGGWLALVANPSQVETAARHLGFVDTERSLSGSSVRTVTPAQMSEFRRLLQRARDAAAAAGPGGFHAEAAHRLEETLVSAAVRLRLQASTQRTIGRPRLNRRLILRKFEEWIRSHPTEPVYVSTLCEAIGISERTLRHVFDEQFGRSPIHILRSRRLRLVQKALLEAGPGARISEIAGRYGFWHMGQFASDFRKLFGVRPSETLHLASEWRYARTAQ